MDFAAALRQATAGQGGSGGARTVATSHPGHIALSSSAPAPTTLLYARPAQTNLDSNTVDMDRERASFADNAVRYEATLRFINGSVRTLLSAITGQ
jgi:flagellar basal-body rod protein FlgB